MNDKRTNSKDEKFDSKRDQRYDKRDPKRGKGKGPRKNYRNDKHSCDSASANSSSRGSDRLSSLNDLSWYMNNPNLLVAAGSFPYVNRPGMAITTMRSTTTAPDKFGIPGIASLDWVPTVGRSELPTDPVNIAAREIYARVRANYSSSLEVDPPDFIIYLMALDSCFSYIGSLKRIFRIINTYSPENYMLPDALMFAVGIPKGDVNKEYENVQHWKMNQMKLFQYINELTAMVSKFTCPGIMDIFARHYWMNDNVYADAPSVNSQLYVFHQTHYLKFKLNDGDLKYGMLEYVPVDLTTVDGAYNQCRDMIDALATDDDAYTINGYFMRTFQNVPSFAVAPIMWEEKLTPVYVEEVLAQIENSATLPYGMFFNDEVAITQSPSNNTIICRPSAVQKKVAGYTTQADYAKSNNLEYTNLISIRADQPTVADNTIATRLKCNVYMWSDTTYKGSSHVEASVLCGTEIPVRWNIWRITARSVGKADYYKHVLTTTAIFDNTDGTPAQKLSDGATVFDYTVPTQFDWFPLIQMCWLTGDVGPTARKEPLLIGDIHNMASITSDDLSNLHRICIYSEFNAFGIL